MNDPGLPEILRRVLSTIDRGSQIQPNWVNGFLLVAADVLGDEVWKVGKDRGQAPK